MSSVCKKNVIVIVHLENDKTWYNHILTIHLKMKKAKETKNTLKTTTANFS